MMALFILCNLLHILYIKWASSNSKTGDCAGNGFSVVNLVVVYFLFFTYLVPSLVVIILLSMHWDSIIYIVNSHLEEGSGDILEILFELLVNNLKMFKLSLFA